MKKGIIIILLILTLVLSTNVGFAADDQKDPMLFLYSVVGTTKTYIDVDVVPGEKGSFSIELYNSGNTKKTNTLFVSDGYTANNGGTLVLTPEEATREKAGSWLNISEEVVTLDPGERKTFDFVIDVPESAALGTHVAVIYLRSAVNPGQESDKGHGGASFIINEVYSLSSAVIIRTGGESKYDFIVEDNMEKSFIKNKDLALFFNISNIGNIYDYPTANILMYNNMDNLLYEDTKKLGVVYPYNNCEVTFMVPHEYYSADIHKMVFSLDYGKDQAKGVQKEFTWDLSSKEVEEAKTIIQKEESKINTGSLWELYKDKIIKVIFILLVVIFLVLLIRYLISIKKPKVYKRAKHLKY